MAKGPKRTKEEEVRYALAILHVRVREKYVIEGDIRQAREIQHFFFCGDFQIKMARQFASGFIVVTDATSNTSEQALILSVLVCITNTMNSFPIAYAYIASESADAFLFLNECMRDLFLYDNCQGPAVMLGDFAAGLMAAMVEPGMEVDCELSARLDDLGSKCFLQPCNWHAAEAIKRRLTQEGYPSEARNELVDKIWTWISSPLIKDISINREALLRLLHTKDQEYLKSFYQPSEHQFIKAYTRLLPNLGSTSSQRGESIHPQVKKVTNRYTPIATAIERIIQVVADMELTCEKELHRQNKHLPRIIDLSRDAFSKISPHITHEAIEMVICEWNAAKRWLRKVEEEEEEAPEVESCGLACDLPKQYSLPCKC